MKKAIRLTESDLHRIVKESVNKILKEEFGVDFEDTLKWVQNKKPNMSPEEQKRFAQNIINKQKGDTITQDGEYQMAHPKNNDEWWIIHIYYGFGGRKEKHYTVYSEEKAKEIIAKWDKWESEKRPRYHYHYECYHVENPNHSSNRDDWYYEHWYPYD